MTWLKTLDFLSGDSDPGPRPRDPGPRLLELENWAQWPEPWIPSPVADEAPWRPRTRARASPNPSEPRRNGPEAARNPPEHLRASQGRSENRRNSLAGRVWGWCGAWRWAGLGWAGDGWARVGGGGGGGGDRYRAQSILGPRPHALGFAGTRVPAQAT